MTKRLSYTQQAFDALLEQQVTPGDIVTVETVLKRIPWAAQDKVERNRFCGAMAALVQSGFLTREPGRRSYFRLYRVTTNLAPQNRPRNSGRPLGLKYAPRRDMKAPVAARIEPVAKPSQDEKTPPREPEEQEAVLRSVHKQLCSLEAAAAAIQEAIRETRKMVDENFSPDSLHEQKD